MMNAPVTPFDSLQSLQKTPEGLKARGANTEAIKKAAVEFEAMFLSQMLEHMYKGIKTDGLMGGGHSEEIFRSFMLDEYAHTIAQSGRLGIADKVMEQLIRTQEASEGGTQ